MFRVKKEDYNSVQFIPDYNSSSTHKSKARRSARLCLAESQLRCSILAFPVYMRRYRKLA